jgi:hypothetical protein
LEGLQAVAVTRPDGKSAAVILNVGDDTQPYDLQFQGLQAAGSIEGHAIQTLLW